MLITTEAFIVTEVPFVKGINEFVFKASLSFYDKQS